MSNHQSVTKVVTPGDCVVIRSVAHNHLSNKRHAETFLTNLVLYNIDVGFFSSFAQI